MRTWLRLTSLFGPPDDTAESSNIICASIGLILQADAEDMVLGPMPEQLAKLLRQISKAEREQRAVSRYGVTASNAVGLIVEVTVPYGTPPNHFADLPVAQRNSRLAVTGVDLQASERSLS
jgi:hypothetical protein